ncbi:cysteine synthase, partial [Bacillus cereus]
RAALGMINKYLQEADEKQNILFYGKLLPSKNCMFNMYSFLMV